MPNSDAKKKPAASRRGPRRSTTAIRDEAMQKLLPARRFHKHKIEQALEIARLLADPGTPEGARTALDDALLELSSATSVHISHPEIAAYSFLHMCAHIRPLMFQHGDDWSRADDARCEVLDIIRRIKQGETFEGYGAESVAAAPVDDSHTRPAATDDHAARLEELRDRLDALDNDDITDSTARYRLEKEIYDIERAAGDDLNDWSAWAEQEGGRA